MTTEKRIARLERSNRMLIVSIVSLLLLAIFVAAAPRDQVAEILMAKRLAIVDENGKVRIALSANENGPTVMLLSETGKAVSNWGTESGRTSITVSDEKGVIRGGIAALTDRTMLVLSNQHGAVMVQMQATDNGPIIETISPSGDRRAITK